MTAKEYLNQARHLDALINCRLPLTSRLCKPKKLH